jgi:hypothetical protein
MKDIPPGENYLFYTEKKGHQNHCLNGSRDIGLFIEINT